MFSINPADRIHFPQCGRLLFTVEAVIEAVGFLSGVQCNIGKQKNEKFAVWRKYTGQKTINITSATKLN